MNAWPSSFRTIALLGAAMLAAGCTTGISAQGGFAAAPAKPIVAPAVQASPPARASVAHLPPASERFVAELANLKAISVRARSAAARAAVEFRRTSSIRTTSQYRNPA
jgi:hypothetical protein